MIKLFSRIKSFKGEIIEGNSKETVEITYKDDIQFKGEIKNYKRDGHGELIFKDKKIVGVFSNDNIFYGIIEYNKGGMYEG